MQLPKVLLGVSVIYLVAGAGHFTFAQSSSSLAPAEKQQFNTTITVKEKKKRSGFFAPKKSKAVKYRKGNVKHTAQYEFYERVEKAAREKQKIMKILARRQYSDPSYFGHKKKPKRRPPHKMRFCDECHIRH